MKNLIKIILFFLSFIVYSQEKEVLIQNPNFNIYILLNKSYKPKVIKTKDNTTYENYRLDWPSTVNYKKLSLK